MRNDCTAKRHQVKRTNKVVANAEKQLHSNKLIRTADDFFEHKEGEAAGLQ